MNKYLFFAFIFLAPAIARAQQLAPTPPMGWMTWNYFAENINEQAVRQIADAMQTSGMVSAGYNYIMIDDGWQGGRDNKNNIIADPGKFPSGIKVLAAYVHSKGIKLGIYSDAAPLTCAGYTGSLNFEEQDARTFASWDIDYLKYDYCNAPTDSVTAKVRYKAMADALRKTKRAIVFGICEWGDRQPWNWAARAGGQLWRIGGDVRDKWKRAPGETWGEGIMEILDRDAELGSFAGPGHWNDPDMLIVGLYGKKGPSGDGGGIGCTDTEYQSQMSLWSMMSAPLTASNDVSNMNEQTKRILLNAEVIAIDQDKLGQQAVRKINDKNFNVFLKQLANGEKAIAILNRDNSAMDISVNFKMLGLSGTYQIRDVWQHRQIGKGKQWKGKVQSHETKLFRLMPIGEHY